MGYQNRTHYNNGDQYPTGISYVKTQPTPQPERVGYYMPVTDKARGIEAPKLRVSKRRQRMLDHYINKALAGASWIVAPPVKNIYRQHQINRKRPLKSGSTFGRVYGHPRKPMK
jgi:hypothetical protein